MNQKSCKGLVDESALYDAICTGRIGRAGLDVFEKEPYEPVDDSKDLRTLENVVLTPHIGSSTQEASLRMAECVVKNIRTSLRKEYDQLDIVNKEVIDKIAG
ncbi:MAG: NAD(P)-dependent oxidoreductase [Planctomycetota bacterium]